MRGAAGSASSAGAISTGADSAAALVGEALADYGVNSDAPADMSCERERMHDPIFCTITTLHDHAVSGGGDRVHCISPPPGRSQACKAHRVGSFYGDAFVGNSCSGRAAEDIDRSNRACHG